jgi:hypothetical protein
MACGHYVGRRGRFPSRRADAGCKRRGSADQHHAEQRQYVDQAPAQRNHGVTAERPEGEGHAGAVEQELARWRAPSGLRCDQWKLRAGIGCLKGGHSRADPSAFDT